MTYFEKFRINSGEKSLQRNFLIIHQECLKF